MEKCSNHFKTYSKFILINIGRNDNVRFYILKLFLFVDKLLPEIMKFVDCGVDPLQKFAISALWVLVYNNQKVWYFFIIAFRKNIRINTHTLKRKAKQRTQKDVFM